MSIGQLISGDTSSSMVTSCEHVVVFPHKSDIWYTLVIICGQSPPSLEADNKMKLKLSITQLSPTLPPWDINSSKLNSPSPPASQAANNPVGHSNVGGIVSFTIIICSHVAVFPHKSDIWYTLVTSSGHVPVPISSLNMVKLKLSMPQLSVTFPFELINSLIVVNDGISSIEHNVVKVSAHIISGKIVSCTMIVCSHVVEFPHKSMIIYVRVIISGQISPSLNSNNNPNDKLSMPQLSFTLPPADINSAIFMYAATSSILHWTSTDSGQLISGSTSSCIVIVWVQLAVFSHWSDIW